MTYTKEEARIEIQKLVEDFRAHEATLENAAEAQIENNFIRPLFSFLNWNTENRGLSHAHYEFKLQVTNKKGLRPDYILSLDGRDVLVMDAKQVKYSMKDPRWLFQVYSYAYSTQNSKPSKKMDFAILTDFQEFIVLDCTLFAAKPEAVNNFRVLDWTYKDYVEKFDELWELLERSNVLNDSLPNVVASRSSAKQSPTDKKEIASGEVQERPRNDRGLWSRYLSPQKVKANRIPPDKAFLAEMDNEKDGWRVLLAKDMKKHNLSADGELITAAVQLLIDRLVFIKALSDREVDKDYLGELAKAVEENGLSEDDTSWFNACKNIFDELNNFYNGSIFAPRPELENVSVSNKVVQSVITDLQPENSPYNFAVLPVEILGTIYERFLGRVVRTTDKRVTIEDKPEVRKAGGVYYTPQYIVDYIVENTLGSLLNECKSPAEVSKLKILDPACGSGSFLIGAFNALITWHKDYFARAGKEKRDRESFYKDESGGIRLTAKLKRDILKNNLFGVDIDPQAVEVTRFSLSLKALEDLREGELTEERTLFHQTVLPDLSENIKNGNSLVGTDYFMRELLPDFVAMKRANAFDWQKGFSEIMNSGGFDVVIGNPPYIRPHNIPDETKVILWGIYSTFVAKSDMYSCFMERGLSLVKPNGAFSFIVPHTWTSLESFTKIREHLIQNANIKKLVQLPKKVFTDATVETCIFTLQKNSEESHFQNIITIEQLDATGQVGLVRKFQQKEIEDAFLFNFQLYGRNESQSIILKVQEGKSLSNFVNLAYGFKTGDDEQFIHSQKKFKESQPCVRSAAISRYFTEQPKEYVWYVPEKMTKNRKTARPGDKERFEAEKIIVARMGKSLGASYDAGGLYVKDAMLLLAKDERLSLMYLLGIINSKLLNYYYQKFFITIDVLKNALLSLPICTIDLTNPAEKSQHEKMVLLVTQMLELHKSKAGAKTQSEQDVYERQIRAVDESIDKLVYKLYGLSEEEIKIVEGR